MRKLVRYFLTVLQLPLFVNTGLRNWNTKTVPVGRSLIKFPRPVSVFSEIELEEEEELVDGAIGRR